MMTASEEQFSATWPTLERWLAGEIPTSDFEQWVYDTQNLEDSLGVDDYSSLLSFDFRQPNAVHELRQLVLKIYNHHRPGCLAHDRAKRLAEGLISGTVDLLVAVRQLAQLNQEGNKWIPVVFVGIDSELDVVPRVEQYPLWDQQALASKLESLQPLIEHYRVVAIAAAKEILAAS
jgi:hypothetical protein